MEVSENYLYSIGYGNRSTEDFFRLLHRFEIKYLIDVRTSPYSKHKPEFNKKSLSISSKLNNISYVFMGNLLGGIPSNDIHYLNGKIDYDLLSKDEKFLEGIGRLVKSHEKKVKSVIMCSELKPDNCHRSKLIGRELKKRWVEILHIDENNCLKSQEEVMNIITKGMGDYDLFGEKPFSSRKKYRDN